MAVFLISAKNDDAQLEANIATFPKEDVLLLDKKQWLIAADATARQLSERLGITVASSPSSESVPPVKTSAAVFSIGNYYGRHSSEVWEWLKLKMEKA